MTYNWQRKEWPNFTYDLSGIEEKQYPFSEKTGLISGILKSLPEDTQMEAIVEVMVAEAIKTSEIEATATRDLQDLLEKGVIVLFGQAGGRSIKYNLRK